MTVFAAGFTASWVSRTTISRDGMLFRTSATSPRGIGEATRVKREVLQLAQGGDRRPFPLGDNGDKAAGPDDPGAVQGDVVRYVKTRSRAGPPQDPGVQHPRQSHVMDIGGPPGHFGPDVEAGQRRSHGLELPRLTQRGVGNGLDVHGHGSGNFGVAEDGAVPATQPPLSIRSDVFGRGIPARGGGADQQHAHIGGRVADGRAAVLHRVAARGQSLIRRAGGIRCHHRYMGRRHIQFLGRHLQQRRLYALAQFGLPGKDGDPPLGVDSNPGIEPGSAFEASGQVWRNRGRAGAALAAAGQLGQGFWREGERHDQSSVFQEGAPGKDRAGPHGCCSFFRLSAAHRTARRMRIWVPQRQRFVCMCRRISASVGEGLR